MRTTIEISDHVRAELLKLSAHRGLKGFSQIVEEALRQYLAGLKDKDRDVKKALRLKGSLPEKEADEILNSVAKVRAKWRR